MDKAECNLIYDIINPIKRANKLNSHYSHILHVCMNTRKGKAKFKNLHMLLYSGCTSNILMGRIVKKLASEKYSLMQWNTQARNITTNLKVKVDFTLSALSATNVVMWKSHMDTSAKGRYDMILG